MKIINIGILAHVDAGKTTVTEHLLYKSGSIKKLGRVDDGDTQTDSMELERSRGITIKASTIAYEWKGVKVNIIDTPGHMDFIAEVERSLRVLDGAVLVISAREGIQSQTRIIFETLIQMKIPTVIFINKLDRMDADSQKVIDELKREISVKLVPINKAIDEGTKNVKIENTILDNYVDEDIYETLSELDDSILKKYINEEGITFEEVWQSICKYSKEGLLFPVFMGVALSSLGIEELLDGINKCLPTTNNCGEGDVSGVVYKIGRSNDNQKLAYIRMYSGTIKLRDTFKIMEGETIDKITKIQVFRNGKLCETNKLMGGDMGIISGLNHFRIGDIIGSPNEKIKNPSLTRPTLRVKVSVHEKEDKNKLFNGLLELAEEDPLLECDIDPIEKEVYISIFGEIQMEIIKDLLSSKHGIDLNFSEVMTIYKETIIQKERASANMFERTNPFYAAVDFEVEPLKRGEGLKYVSQVSFGYLSKSFQNAVEEAVFQTCHQGIYGWEITDVLITFKDAIYDSVMSTPSDFRNLTPMVLMEAIYKAKTKLLEPIYEFHIKVPKEVGSRVVVDLQNMRAIFSETGSLNDQFYIKGYVPIETSKNYNIKLASFTEGKGIFYTKFYGYIDLPEDVIKSKSKYGLDPLNKRKYLLQKSSAIKN